MNIIHIQNKPAPLAAKNILQGKAIEEQLQFFRLEKCYKETHFVDARVIKDPSSYKGDPQEITDDMALLVCDDIIVGIKIDDEEIYSFSLSPCSKVISWDGHRTSCDPWYYDEKHCWYTFKCYI